MQRNALAGMLLLLCCLYSLLARDTYGSDFRAYYVAAQAAHAGLDPYLNQVNVSEQYADRDWLEVNSRFIYPPSSLLLFAPFARLPYRVAKVVWGTGMALLMAALLLALCQRYAQTGDPQASDLQFAYLPVRLPAGGRDGARPLPQPSHGVQHR